MSDNCTNEEHAQDEHSKERSNLYFGIEITLNAVQDVDQTFSCVITLQMYWRKNRDILTKAPRSFKRESIEDDKLPKIDIHLTSSKEMKDCEYWESDTGDCYASLDYDLVINEPLELHRFPYDRQLLKLQMSCKDYVLKGLCNLDEELRTVGISRKDLFPQGFLQKSLKKNDSSLVYDHDTWKVIKHHTKVKELPSKKQSICFITIRVQRCPNFYVYNFCSVLYIVVGSGATVHFTEWSDFSTRSSLLLTMLVAAISYRFSTNNFLPLINYLTLMDIYILFGFFGLLCIVVESFWLWTNRESDVYTLNKIDRLFFRWYLWIWTGVNAFIFLTCFIPGLADLCIRMPWKQVKANDDKSTYTESGKFDNKDDDYEPKPIVLPTLSLRSRQNSKYQRIKN